MLSETALRLRDVTSLFEIGVGGVALERIVFFGRSERPKNISTDKFSWGSFSGRT